MKNQQEQFQTMLQMFMQQQQTQSQALLELLKKRNGCYVRLICLDFMGVVVFMVTLFGNGTPLSPYSMHNPYLLLF